MKKEALILERDFIKANYRFFVIAADIGGSNSYFAIMGVRDNKNFDIIMRYSCSTYEVNKVYDILNEMLYEAKRQYNIEVNRCCIGGAGPISRKRGYIKLTNFYLKIDSKEILSNSMLNRVILVNDFEAIGYGLDLLDINKDAIQLEHIGEDLTRGWTPTNTFSVIGAGTGLGMSIAYYDFSKYIHIPLPSEGGHIDFPPYDNMEIEYVEFLKKTALEKKEVHPEFERVLSGFGMENIYNFIRYKTLFKETEITKMIDQLKGNEKLHEIDTNYGRDQTCTKTVDMVINFYARAARALALMSESYGGLFITGRIALNNIDRFKDGKFMGEFEKHDKRSDVLRKTPVYIITNRDVGLYGCCNVAVNFFNIC
jgi:glucokinase